MPLELETFGPAATDLNSLGYEVAILCDNDEPTQFSAADATDLEALGVKIFMWENDRSIEQQLFADLPWDFLDGLIEIAADAHDSKSKYDLVQAVQAQHSGLTDNPAEWSDSAPLREIIGKVAAGKLPNGASSAGKKGWFKRINSSEAVFAFAMPNLIATTPIREKLDLLWQWIQGE